MYLRLLFSSSDVEFDMAAFLGDCSFEGGVVGYLGHHLVAGVFILIVVVVFEGEGVVALDFEVPVLVFADSVI